MSDMTVQEQRDTYYDVVREQYLGMKAALDYNRTACETEIKIFHDAIEHLAAEILPTYDSEFFHKNLDDHDGWDLEGDDAELYEDCLEAYNHARGRIAQFGNERDIAERHQATRDKMIAEMQRLAKQAFNEALPGFWKGEPWENEFKRWSYNSWGVETP